MALRKPGLYFDLDESEYHADTDTLSSTGAKLLLPPGCPRIFQDYRDNRRQRESKCLDFGSCAHVLLLGRGKEIEIVEHDTWQKSAAKQQRDEAREAGRLPVLRPVYETAKTMVTEVHRDPEAAALFRDGAPEVSAYCLDGPTWTPLRARADWLTDWAIVDYKTAAFADPDGFGRASFRLGYYQQAAWYIDVFAAVGIDIESFKFVAQMKEPPYLVAVYELSDNDIQRGRDRNRRAIDIYTWCTENNQWPKWNKPPYLKLPNWRAA